MKWVTMIAGLLLALLSLEAPGLGAVSGGMLISATILHVYEDKKKRYIGPGWSKDFSDE